MQVFLGCKCKYMSRAPQGVGWRGCLSRQLAGSRQRCKSSFILTLRMKNHWIILIIHKLREWFFCANWAKLCKYCFTANNHLMRVTPNNTSSCFAVWIVKAYNKLLNDSLHLEVLGFSKEKGSSFAQRQSVQIWFQLSSFFKIRGWVGRNDVLPLRLF